MGRIPVWDYLWDLGVPGNLIASAILGFGALIVGYVKIWVPHVRPHMQNTADIRRHLDPTNDWHIGDD